MAETEIGLGKSGRRAYRLDEIAIIPSRRTRDPEDVDISWQIDAYRFDIPVLAASTDSVTSPATAVQMGELGGVGVLDLEGVWTRCEDPTSELAELGAMPVDTAAGRLRELYSRPIQPELVAARIAEIAETGVRTAGRVRPQRAVELAPHAISAEIDLLVISGTIVSAEHVSSSVDPLNLKTFIRRMQTPVIVGGCVSYQAALHIADALHEREYPAQARVHRALVAAQHLDEAPLIGADDADTERGNEDQRQRDDDE